LKKKKCPPYSEVRKRSRERREGMREKVKAR